MLSGPSSRCLPRVTRHAPRAIARRLNDNGIPGPSGGLWRDTTIRGHITRGTGILNNELYIGRLVWNRLRYVKDPDTGKRVSRINDPSEWVVTDVPELRIIEDGLWARVKARQSEIRDAPGVEKARQTRFWERRRPKHLLTGKVFCPVCGSAFASIGKDYLGCSTARSSGACSNTQSLRRTDLENHILDALKCKLMAPDLVEAFISEFHAELNRQTARETTLQASKIKELAVIERKLDGLYDAIADGLRTEGLKSKLQDLEQRKADLEAGLAEGTAPPPLLHPNLAQLYAKQVSNLSDALQQEDLRTDALDLLRNLIDRVETGPKAEDGSRPIELVGDITAMIEAGSSASDSKKPASGGAGVLGAYASSAKVVAGVRNQRYFALTQSTV